MSIVQIYLVDGLANDAIFELWNLWSLLQCEVTYPDIPFLLELYVGGENNNLLVLSMNFFLLFKLTLDIKL